MGRYAISLANTAIAKEPLFGIANANAIAKAVWTEPKAPFTVSDRVSVVGKKWELNIINGTVHTGS